MRSNILLVIVCYNTAEQTRRVLKKIPSRRDYDVLIVDDASGDKTSEYIREHEFKVIEHTKNKGVGGAIKSGIKHALESGYRVMAVMAGNDKDDPQEVPRLLDPILREKYDYVQGSRFVRGGQWDNLPRFRYIMVKVHAGLLTLLTGRRCTDALNGFRAYKLMLFRDPRINVWQEWLDRYELETYLHYKVLKYGYRFKEVPVSKIYPPRQRKIKYSHIRPVFDWWSILRPLFLTTLGVKK